LSLQFSVAAEVTRLTIFELRYTIYAMRLNCGKTRQS
jgi:hypothetical protein